MGRGYFPNKWCWTTRYPYIPHLPKEYQCLLHTIHKNLTEIKDASRRAKTLEVLEENIGGKSCDLEFGKDFLRYKMWTIKEKKWYIGFPQN